MSILAAKLKFLLRSLLKCTFQDYVIVCFGGLQPDKITFAIGLQDEIDYVALHINPNYAVMVKPSSVATSSIRKLPNNAFHITIPVKPYVKRFLELNFGDPVYFHPDKGDYAELRNCLKESRRVDSRFPPKICTYSCDVTVVLSERDFYRFGWEMSKNNIVRFGSHFEMKAKALMRSMVGLYHALGLPINISITRFQDKFYFDENVWPYQSIKKDFYRNGAVEQIDFENEIFSKVEKIVLSNLYKMGTITPGFIKDYENDQ